MPYTQTRPVGFAGSTPPQRVNRPQQPSQSGFAPPANQPFNPNAGSGFGGSSTPAAAPQAQPQQPSQPWGDNAWLNDAAAWTPSRFSEWAPYKILAQLQMLSDQGVRDMYGAMPAYQSARGNAYNMLGPGGTRTLLDYFRNQQMGQADDMGMRNAAMLRSQGIQGADASAMLDARNRAADATNDYASELYSPEGAAERYMKQMGLMSPQAANPLLETILALFGPAAGRVQQNNAEHASRAKNSGLGGVLGSVLGMATGGFGGIGSLFGGGGGSAPSYGQGGSMFVPGHF